MTTLHYMNGPSATTHSSDDVALAERLGCVRGALHVKITPTGRWVVLWTFRCAGAIVARLA